MDYGILITLGGILINIGAIYGIVKTKVSNVEKTLTDIKDNHLIGICKRLEGVEQKSAKIEGYLEGIKNGKIPIK